MIIGSISLSSSQDITSNANFREGFELKGLCGGHFCVKRLTIGKSMETGSPYLILSFLRRRRRLYDFRAHLPA